MKKQKAKLILFTIITIILILCIFLGRDRKRKDSYFQDDLIFFKSFSSNLKEKEIEKISENQVEQQYNFQVSYKNIDFKEINLVDTIKQETLIHEKIAPGTEGNFEIILQANQKMNYRIQFKSTNDKPQNLYFQVKGKDRKYTNLEEMESELQGKLNKNKRIVIEWKWEYERNEKQNLQDTKDGKTIQQYHFMIYAIGE